MGWERIQIVADPFFDRAERNYHAPRGLWPGKWIAPPGGMPVPSVWAFRRRFELADPLRVRVHLSGDERYRFFVDGKPVGRGPERGALHCWHFETADLELGPGAHCLVAQVWALGAAFGPMAQISVEPGFLLVAEGETGGKLLTTGVAEWEVCRVGGVLPIEPGLRWGTGGGVVIDASVFPWGFETGAGEGWIPAEVGARARSACGGDNNAGGRRLVPAALPAMIERPVQTGVVRHLEEPTDGECGRWQVLPERHGAEEAADWERMLAGVEPVEIPAGNRRRVLIDLGDYYCAYPEVRVSGGAGAVIEVFWAEALYEAVPGGDPHAWPKGDRDGVAGKTFVGFGDRFLTDGEGARRFETLWWSAGRYVTVEVSTGGESVRIEGIVWNETRYPFEPEAGVSGLSAVDAAVVRLGIRTLQMCSHETYFDCPYYEQLMYVGDTRLEVLTWFCLSHDDALPAKAVDLFERSRLLSGLTQSRFPSRDVQVIPTFSLWWICMVEDRALWRDDPARVLRCLPGVRGVIDAFLAARGRDGLVEALPGWNFVDWVHQRHWRDGMPPGAEHGVSAAVNLQLVLALEAAARLEAGFGDPELSARNGAAARNVAAEVDRRLRDPSSGLILDAPGFETVSEHAQALAVLSDAFGPEARERNRAALLDALPRRIERDPAVGRASIYFSFYLFEAWARLGLVERIDARLEEWREATRLGFRTLRETPEPSRSDCHAWASHPIFHHAATFLGIRPAAYGFRRIRVRPQLPPGIDRLEGRVPHPRGWVEVVAVREGGASRVESVSAPEGVRVIVE